ncbi:benzil reductase ((S)-benzoin forming) Irc24p [[Candida] anglica]|uniref:Benzil reductase ((S)-benzoin forming) Irc24p n=1 Tax=[Candida] anglica TaxID=148631 RepID=A0ABP0E8A1_9ASCO
MSTVYLVTGGNRGIGYKIVEQLAARPNTKVLATARNVESAVELKELQAKHHNIEILKLDVSSEESLDALDNQLQKVAPDGIDVLISNAGIADGYYTVKDAPRSIWLKHHKTNVLGPIFLYQVVRPYLMKRDTRKIIFVSSVVGSLGGFLPFSTSAYGQSKAALNMTMKQVSLEDGPEGFTVIAMHPGMVSSDMGKDGISRFTKEDLVDILPLVITPEVSATKQLEVIDGLTKEDNGAFFNYDGTASPF